jgi:hypothetical protein
MRKLKSEVDVELEGDDGKRRMYTLRYDLNALATFEDIYDQSFLEIFSPSLDENGNLMVDETGQPINVSFRIGMIRDLIWVGLMARHPEIEKDTVGSMFDVKEATEQIMPKITEALALSNQEEFPAESGNGVGKATPKK